MGSDESQKALDTIFSFVPTLVLKSALLLKIPDIIAREGPEASLSLHEIAALLPTQTPNLHYLSRILTYLSAKGIFIQSQANNEPSYALTNTAKLFFVNEKNPFSLVPVALMQSDEVLQKSWHYLHESVLHGCQAFEKAHGKDLWSYGKDDPHVNNIVNDCMASFTMMGMAQIVNCYEGFREVQSMVDVGGGKGTALGQIVKAYPHIQGINFDLPHVVATAPSIPGIQHVGGNMFESIPSAGAIFIKKVLIDWDDESCSKIFENCYKALPENGRLILAEDVVQNHSTASESLEMVADLIMMAHANGGRERSEEEWKKMLHNSGFPLVKVVGLPGIFTKLKIVEAIKMKTE
ncbi:hypothetical protein SUGI_1123150 [Cryptomeria japonica]|uniref:(R,S)-reticuline 7-O-methyltransferase n=1 Tax=Cryptomeria japonica TaxID=3369 RepID=UPI0024149E39|nr:(R,S)-reticuline 7-O-methyltransferase [Cryptomeria japonica]GLJ52747.1 hypothetical protein SUGI_1123150 [Cryptomeria japonica]